MPTELEKSYKSLLDKAEKIQVEAGNDPMTEAQLTEYESCIKQAQVLQKQIELQGTLKAAKDWGGLSQGSIVASVQELPGKGDMKGVAADPKSGEMYAFRQYGETALNAMKSGKYKDAIDDYLRHGGGSNDPYKSAAMKVLNEGGFTTGEAWLPPDFRPHIIQKMATMTTIRPNATIFTTGTDSITFPQVVYTDDDLYTTGVRPSWRNSNPLAAGITEATNPIAGNVRIPVNLVTFAITASREQTEDNSFDLLGFITNKMSEAAALFTENAYWNGNGDGQPQGVLSHPSVRVANGSTTTVGGLTIKGGYIKSGVNGNVSWQGASGSEDSTLGILGMEGALPPQYDFGGKWFGTKKTFAAIRGLVDSQKRPLWNQTDGQWANWIRGYPLTLVGYPIEKNQFIPELTTGSYGSLIFGDMSAYHIVDRVGLSVEVNREIFMDRDQILIYARMRTGGQLLDYWKLKFLYASV